MEPEAMYCPVGSNRAAKTSPEWPVSSITGDCSALLREPYAAYQHVQASAIVVFSQTASISTYRLDERSILPAAIHYCDGRAAAQVRIGLCALHQLARAEAFVRGALRGGHCSFCLRSRVSANGSSGRRRVCLACPPRRSGKLSRGRSAPSYTRSTCT
jgi:hypothetical protein